MNEYIYIEYKKQLNEYIFNSLLKTIQRSTSEKKKRSKATAPINEERTHTRARTHARTRTYTYAKSQKIRQGATKKHTPLSK